ncbi:alpha/beta fold hydrolase [Streptomyces sp. NPDC003483]
MDAKSGAFVTNDGVTIRYREAGSGRPLVMLPGFSQTAAEFSKQLDALSDEYRVIAVDQRGHGDSDKPNYGYRISRFAADLRDLLVTLDINEVSLLGHSLGCTVIWNYWDLYGGDRVRSLVLVDQGPTAAIDVAPEDQIRELGATFTHEDARNLTAGWRGTPEEAKEASRSIVHLLHTGDLDNQDRNWLLEQNLTLPSEHAATLYMDHYGNDWRDILPRITVPTLIIGGEVSFLASEVAKRNAAQIPNSHLRIFSAEERGSHIMFWENPNLFNSTVREFLKGVG